MGRLPTDDQIILGDNLDILPGFADESFQLVYIDPPFNTGKDQRRKTLETVPDVDGDRTGSRVGGTRPRCLPNRRIAMPSTRTSRSSRRAWRRRADF